MPKEDMDESIELENILGPFGAYPTRMKDLIMSWHKKQLQKAVIEARKKTLEKVLEQTRSGKPIPKRRVTITIKKLESQLKDMEGR